MVDTSEKTLKLLYAAELLDQTGSYTWIAVHCRVKKFACPPDESRVRIAFNEYIH